MSDFSVQGTEFSYESSGEVSTLHIKSSPRDYRVDFTSEKSIEENLGELLAGLTDPIVLCDQNVFNSHFESSSVVTRFPTLYVEASEKFKSIDGVFAVLDFMSTQRVGRGSTVVVLGGGIVQDVGAFACGVFKRGVPWVYLPTTLLSANRQLYRVEKCFELSRCEESCWNVLGTSKSDSQLETFSVHCHSLRSTLDWAKPFAFQLLVVLIRLPNLRNCCLRPWNEIGNHSRR